MAEPAKPDLPPALKARLMARGLLPIQGQSGEHQGSAEAGPRAAGAHYASPPQPPQPALQDEPLLPGWLEAVDPRHMRPYYYNPTTGRQGGEGWSRSLSLQIEGRGLIAVRHAAGSL